MMKDPAYRKKERERSRDLKREMRKDPVRYEKTRKRMIEWNRERMKDPAFRKQWLKVKHEQYLKRLRKAKMRVVLAEMSAVIERLKTPRKT